ncbi:hypothetical protein TNCV_2237381 [Trichonephila clavipes]|nr:hypothetical protein TNCV_2237381 [Trichonephila clavipes]
MGVTRKTLQTNPFRPESHPSYIGHLGCTQQNNARLHFALSSLLGFDILSWPANPPGMNIIELLWDIIGRDINLGFYRAVPRMLYRIEKPWMSSDISELVVRMVLVKKDCHDNQRSLKQLGTTVIEADEAKA